MVAAFEMDSERYASEIFEREVVVLNLIEGTYYAFGGAAREVWFHLTARQPIDEIAAKLARIHGASPAEVSMALEAFSARLLDEGILRRAATSADTSVVELTPHFDKFIPPTFEKHVDMQDLLTLDPIHDVDPESGWPNV
jgi:hypothetical protein